MTHLALLESTVVAIERIAAARKDVDVVLAKLQPKDKKAEEPKEDPNKALKDAAKDLQKKLTEMEKRFWVTPDTKGIVDDRTLMASVDSAMFPVLSTFEPPSPTATKYLEHAEAAARKTLADFNKLFAEDVAAFRRRVGEAKIELLPEGEPISIEQLGKRPGVHDSGPLLRRLTGADWSLAGREAAPNSDAIR